MFSSLCTDQCNVRGARRCWHAFQKSKEGVEYMKKLKNYFSNLCSHVNVWHFIVNPHFSYNLKICNLLMVRSSWKTNDGNLNKQNLFLMYALCTPLKNVLLNSLSLKRVTKCFIALQVQVRNSLSAVHYSQDSITLLISRSIR